MKSKYGNYDSAYFFSNEHFHFAEQLRPQNAKKVLPFLISSVESKLLGNSQACHFLDNWPRKVSHLWKQKC